MILVSKETSCGYGYHVTERLRRLRYRPCFVKIRQISSSIAETLILIHFVYPSIFPRMKQQIIFSPAPIRKYLLAVQTVETVADLFTIQRISLVGANQIWHVLPTIVQPWMDLKLYAFPHNGSPSYISQLAQNMLFT